MSDSLVLLPVEVFRGFVLPFLRVSDCVNLDSAVLSTSLRPGLLRSWDGHSIDHCEPLFYINEASARWLTVRNIQLRTITFDRSCRSVHTGDNSAIHKLVLGCQAIQFDKCETGVIASTIPFCGHIVSASIQNCATDLLEVARLCPALKVFRVSLSEYSMLKDFAVLTKVCKHLVEIDLSSRTPYIIDAQVSAIAEHCPQLRVLVLDGCTQCSDAAVVAIATHCTQLTRFSARACFRLRSRGVEALARGCPHLTSVNFLDVVSVSTDDIITLAIKCPLLEEVRFAHCNKEVDNAVVSLALKCKNLQVLHCQSWHITGVAMQALWRCQRLHTVIFFNNICIHNEVCSDDIVELLNYCPGLRRLELPYSPSLTGGTVSMVQYPALQHVCLSSRVRLFDLDIVALAQHGPSITHLDLSACSQLTDAALLAVAAHCTLLETINLTNVTALSDASVIVLAQRCRRLSRITLTGCVALTDAAVSAIAHNCARQLLHLAVAHCAHITDTCIAEIAQHCGRLRSIDLWACVLLTPQSLHTLSRCCKRLYKVNVQPSDPIAQLQVDTSMQHK